MAAVVESPVQELDRVPAGASEAFDGDPGDGLWSPRRRTLTFGLVLTITLVAFEALAVTTILPIITGDLGDIELYGWVFSAFFLGSLIGIAVVGGLIDRVGLVRPFVLGLALFGVGLLIGGLAPSMPILILGRFIQGLGGGAIPPTGYVAIGRSMPESLRPAMFATLATAWVVPGLIGPAIAATVAEQIGWRLVFIGLIPIVVLAGVMTVPALRRVPAAVIVAGGIETAAAGLSVQRIRLALVLTGGAFLVLAGLTSDSIVVLVVLVALGLVLAVPAFARLAPPGTLRLKRGLPAAILLRGVLTFTFFAPDVYLPLAFQGWRGVSALLTGIGLTAATLTWTAAAWVQARYIGRFGPEWFIRVGFAIVTLGTAATTLVLWPDFPLWAALIAWGVAAVGMGFSYSALSLIVLRDATPGEEGGPASALQLSDVLGSALGTGIGGAILAIATRAGEPLWVGLAGAFGLAVIVGALGFLGTARLFKPKAVEVQQDGRRAADTEPELT